MRLFVHFLTCASIYHSTEAEERRRSEVSVVVRCLRAALQFLTPLNVEKQKIARKIPQDLKMDVAATLRH